MYAGDRAICGEICDRLVWHGMSRDIRYWTRTCTACQRAKVSQHVVAPLTHLPMPDKRFDSLHVDIVGPFAGITRFHISVDDCGSFHEVAGSHTAERHFCTYVCSRVLVSLGFAIWCADYIDK